MLNSWDRMTAQTLLEKLDRNHITLSEALAVADRIGIQSQARTKAQLARDINAALRVVS